MKQTELFWRLKWYHFSGLLTVFLSCESGNYSKCCVPFQNLNFHVIIKTHTDIFHFSSKLGIMAGLLVDAFRCCLTTFFLGMRRFLVQEFSFLIRAWKGNCKKQQVVEYWSRSALGKLYNWLRFLLVTNSVPQSHV